jgi:hypothetical protein
MSVRRSRDRRTTAVDAIAQKLSKLAQPCVALVAPADPAEPAGFVTLLMACPVSAACPTCTDARTRLRPWPDPPAPAPMAKRRVSDDDGYPYEKDI